MCTRKYVNIIRHETRALYYYLFVRKERIALFIKLFDLFFQNLELLRAIKTSNIA